MKTATKDKETATESTEVMKVSSTTALANTNGIDLEADSAEYQEAFSKDDFAMPFLRILQTNSPEATEGDAEYIDPCKPGWVLITATKEVFDTIKGSLIFVPVTYRRTFIEWILRDAGGGFVKDHGLIAGGELIKRCTQNEKGAWVLPDTQGKHQLVETQQYLVLYQNARGQFHPAMLSFTSTQLKKGRLLNSTIDGLRITVKDKEVKPPMFYQAYSMSAIREENEKGKWFGYKIETHAALLELPNGIEAYKTAKSFRDQVAAGEVDLSKAAEAEANAGGDATAPGNAF